MCPGRQKEHRFRDPKKGSASLADVFRGSRVSSPTTSSSSIRAASHSCVSSSFSFPWVSRPRRGGRAGAGAGPRDFARARHSPGRRALRASPALLPAPSQASPGRARRAQSRPRRRRTARGPRPISDRRARRTSHQSLRSNELAELRHRDASKCECRRVVAQGDLVQCAKGIARCEARAAALISEFDLNPATLVTPTVSMPGTYLSHDHEAARRIRNRPNEEGTLAELDPAPFPPASRAAHELVVAGIAMRRLQTKTARATGIPALMAEVESASLVLNTPAARLIARGEERHLVPEDVKALLASKALVVDACRHVVRDARTVVSLASRPILLALARALGEAWPGDVPRDALVARAFRAKLADEAHRARLRVEVGRLRAVLRALPVVSATKRGLPWRRAVHASSSCWRGPSKSNMRPCWPSLPAVNRGRALPWRLRWGPASAPCSGHSTCLRQQARCRRLVAGERAVG